ncbi:MAG: hypothetical protein J5879_04110 [Clostridia bacterium]|nr:hypothetical protein [Clostridia bacterium]
MMSWLFGGELSAGDAKNVRYIIVFMFIGVVLAAAVSLYHKHVLGSFIRFLVNSGASDEETAIRFDTTRFRNNLFVRAAIRNGRTYSSVLRSVSPEEAGDGGKRSASKQLFATRFYIPEELTFRAENIFSKKGTTVVSAIFSILLFLLITAVSLVVVPGIVDMLQEMTGGL